MDLVFLAEHGLLTAGGLPVAESDTQLAHTRPEPFSIYAGLPRWLADGMSVGSRHFSSLSLSNFCKREEVACGWTFSFFSYRSSCYIMLGERRIAPSGRVGTRLRQVQCYLNPIPPLYRIRLIEGDISVHQPAQWIAL